MSGANLAASNGLNGKVRPLDTSDPIRVVVADRRSLCRESLRLLIESLDPEIDVLEVNCPTEVASMLGNRPGRTVVVYTLVDGSESECENLKKICDTHRSMRLVVLSDSDDRALARSVMGLGAKAFLPSTIPGPVVVAVLRVVVAGGLYVPPSLLLDAGNQRSADPAFLPREEREAAIGDAFGHLTRRQRTVLALLSEGCTNRKVAEILGVRENTVKAHVKQIMHKMGANNRTQAALMADRMVLRGA